MGHTPKTNELCPHGLDPNICGYCWNKAIANMIDENTNLKQTVATQQARIKALEKLLDPKILARKIGDWDFTHNSDYFCWKFGGDGDNGEMLIEALAALLEAEK